MITPIVYVVPYYNNPGMLALQVENWNRYKGELAASVKLIVVDDHSDVPPVDALKACKLKTELHRATERIPWNMHQCRNVGAQLAGRGGQRPWLFLTDMDIMLTPEAAYTMLNRELDQRYHYTQERTFAPEFTERKTHANTLLVTYSAFWQVNGYDLDLTPVGGGGYGGDAQFMKQIAAICPRKHMDDVVLVGYGRRSRDGQPVFVDADTQGLSREEWHEKYKAALLRKRQSGDLRSLNPIRTNYERLL